MPEQMESAQVRTAVYTGSFDPVTLGHTNVIQRASGIFDRLIVGVGTNVEKQSLFSLSQRVAIVADVTAAFPNVEVREFDGLAVRFVRDVGARIMVRGIRPLTDTAAEFTMMLANRQLDPEIETVFLMADQSLAHVSSSLIKQMAPVATDQMLAEFIPVSVIPHLRERMQSDCGTSRG